MIGPILKDLLERVVRATAPSYPPTEYSDAQVWNREALEDALHGWVAATASCVAAILPMLLRANSTAHLRAMLSTSFGQWLTNERTRTSATNLFTRTKKMLRERFRAVGPMRARCQSAVRAPDGPAEPSRLANRALLAIAHELDDDALKVIRYGPNSLKSSPISRAPARGVPSAPAHARFRSAHSGQIAEVERCGFNLPTLEHVELETALEEETISIPARVERSDLARSVLMRLSPDQERIITGYASADSPKLLPRTRRFQLLPSRPDLVKSSH